MTPDTTIPPVFRVIISNVRRMRTQCNLSQHELAARAGVHTSTVKFVETGRVGAHFMRLCTLESLAHALGTTAAELTRERRADEVEQ